MKTSTKVISAGMVSAVLAGASFTAFSGSDRDGGRGHHDLNPELINQVSLSAEQAMAIALADVPGKVIEAELEHEDGKMIWEIELLNNENQFYEFEIDANDGRILEKELDNH